MSISIPFIVTINLRYFIHFTPNLYFLILIYKPVFYSLSKTFLTWTWYLSSLSKYIRILSIYRSIYLLIYSLNSKSIWSQSIIGVFISLNSIIRYLKYLSRHLNTIFYSSPFFIRIRLYAPRRLMVVNYSAP